VIPKKSESKYVSALPKILNGPSLLTWWSAMCSIIFGPFRLLGNAHLFNWLFRWPVGVDMWCWSCRPEVRIRRRVHEKIWQIWNLLKAFEVRTLSNSNANFVTSLCASSNRSAASASLNPCNHEQRQVINYLFHSRNTSINRTVFRWFSRNSLTAVSQCTGLSRLLVD